MQAVLQQGHDEDLAAVKERTGLCALAVLLFSVMFSCFVNLASGWGTGCLMQFFLKCFALIRVLPHGVY